MADRKWYIANAGRQDGPYSDEQLRVLIAGGRVDADTLVWSTGMENWTKAGAIPRPDRQRAAAAADPLVCRRAPAAGRRATLCNPSFGDPSLRN
jgi:hypothetical protein